jgi:hypothetical protein
LERRLRPAAARIQQVTLMVNESAVVVFDDERAVVNAGVMLPGWWRAGSGSSGWSMRRSISATATARRIADARSCR